MACVTRDEWPLASGGAAPSALIAPHPRSLTCQVKGRAAVRDFAAVTRGNVNVRFPVAPNALSLWRSLNEDLHLEFNEADERRYLAMMLGLLLERAFAHSSEFEHMCMSAGEALCSCLQHLDAAEDDGWSIHLTMPKDWIRNKVRLAKLTDLPAVSDVLEIALSFEAQYGTVPLDYQTGQRAQFASDISALLRQMGMLNRVGIPNDYFLLMMTNHHFLKPVNGMWNAKIEFLLKNLADKTLGGAPEEFTVVVRHQSKHPLTWAEGYLNRHWRYGHWLSDQELTRSITHHHSALPAIVINTLADGGNGVFVPVGYRQ